MIAMLKTIAIFAGGGLLLGLVGLWALNYSKAGNAPDATRRTSAAIIGVISGVVLTFVIAVSEVAALMGLFGDVFAMYPGGFGQVALGILAVAGVTGMLEVGVIGATILVVLVIAVTAAVKN